VKRRVALLFAAAVLLLVAASLLVARTAWVGDALCRGLAERIRAETGQPFHAESCRVAPLRLAVEARGLRVGPPEAPLFQAEVVRLRLAPLQALEGTLEVAEMEVVRPRIVARIRVAHPRRDGALHPGRAVVRRLQQLRREQPVRDAVRLAGTRCRRVGHHRPP